MNNLLSGRARVCQNTWGSNFYISGRAHGIVIFADRVVYGIWVGGNSGSYAVSSTKIAGSENLTFNVDKNSGSVTVTHAGGTIGGYCYIGI